MKKFCIETLLFTVLLLTILFFLKMTVPYYWGNDLIKKKISYLNNNENSFDTYFVGSSKTYRHINPILFDELSNTNSFNLGAAGTFGLETEYLLEHYFDNLNASNNTVFLQGLTFKEIAKTNQHSVRATYFMDYKRTIRGTNYFLNQKKYNQAYIHVSSFIENLLCIGQFEGIANFHFSKRFEKLKPIIEKQHGFFGLDQELELTQDPELKSRNKKYLKRLKNKKNRRPEKELKIRKINASRLGMNLDSDKVNLWQIRGNPISNMNFYFDKSHYNLKGVNEFTQKIAEKSKHINN